MSSHPDSSFLVHMLSAVNLVYRDLVDVLQTTPTNLSLRIRVPVRTQCHGAYGHSSQIAEKASVTIRLLDGS